MLSDSLIYLPATYFIENKRKLAFVQVIGSTPSNAIAYGALLCVQAAGARAGGAP